jgi:UDP-2,3-diacylglucosamine pyrophosphatase LpxH
VAFLHNIGSTGGAKLIINGDFIDFPQIPLDGKRSIPPNDFLGTTEAESLHRLECAIAGHLEEFEALKHFLSRSGNTLFLLAGNHDIDFCWQRVLKRFRQHIGATNRNFRFGMAYKEGGVYATHGHQYSHENRIDAPIDFTFNRLHSCWGTLFVERFFNRVEDRYPMLDNARPTWKAALSAILHDDIAITGQFAAEFLMFFTQFGMPLKEYASTALFGWKPKTRAIHPRSIGSLTDHLSFSQLRDQLQSRRGDATFRREFDALLEHFYGSQGDVLRSLEYGLSQEPLDMLQESEPETGTARALFAKTDNYQEAAKLITQYHPGTRLVIMGHTHRGQTAQLLRSAPSQNGPCTYANTGTWTKHYEIPWWQLPKFEHLVNPAHFHPSSDVIQCSGADDHLEATYFAQTPL